MPHVDLRDPGGMHYRISTTSRETLQAWFDEWLPRLYPAELPPEYGYPNVMIYPLFTGDSQRAPDWVTYAPVLGTWRKIPRDPANVMEVLDQIRDRLEAEAARREEARSHGR